MTENEMITVNRYFNYLKEGKLMGSQCPKCHHIDLPARRLCSQCQSEAQWKELSGKGKLHAFTAISVGTPIMGQKGYDRSHPYIFAIGLMEEGPMVSGLMRESEKYEENPDQLKIGIPLKATFVQTQIGKDRNGQPLFRWDVGFIPIE